MNSSRQRIWLTLACLLLPLALFGDLVPGDFAVTRVSKDEIVIMALKQIPINEEIRVTDDYWIDGQLDNSGSEAVFTLNRTLSVGEQYLFDLTSSGVTLEWEKNLHFYQYITTPYGTKKCFLFMIEANLEGLSWFPTTPGLERDITHIVIKEVDTIPGVIDHILTDTLVFKDLTPYRWLRALGSFRAWIALNDFQNGPLLEFLDFKFSVKDSPGVINFVTDAYQLSEQANSLFVPIRRQYGTDGSASVDIFASKDIEPFDSWSNEGYDDYYTDLTSVAFDPSQNFVVAVGPTSGEILHGNGSGWIRKDTNNTPGTNLELTGITHDGSAFWACALDGKIYKSSDGVSWTEKYPAPNGPVELYRIFYLEDAALANEPALFALGENGLILYEDPNDGWIASSTGLSSGRLFSICFNGLDFVAVGDDGVMIHTRDLESTWQTISNPYTANLYSITYAPFTQGGGFYAVGQNGILLYSSDLTVGFTRMDSGTRESLFSVTHASFDIDPGSGVTIADYVITCGANSSITAAKNGGVFETRRSIHRASALYSAVPIAPSGAGSTANTWLAVGEYGAVVELNLFAPILSGNPSKMILDDNASTSVSWVDDENGEKYIEVEATTVELFRQRIDLTLKRPATGGGEYRMGHRRTQVNL
ncbi:MAG: hypothetical protein HRT56_04930, partial [Coraliomargarita sp.]|nr:hypothetical protein [Coraliomargarita sp.]